MLKRVFIFSLIAVFTLCSPASGDTSCTGEVVELPAGTVSATWDVLVSWGREAGFIAQDDVLDPSEIISRYQAYRLFWRSNGSPANQSGMYLDMDGGDRPYVASWAARVEGAVQESGGYFRPDDQMSEGDFLMLLWRANGCPAPSLDGDDGRSASMGGCAIAYQWACGCGLLNKSERESFDPQAACTVFSALSHVYYAYHARKAFAITVDQFLEALSRVTEQARTGGYRYGNSTAADPTTDGIISCDRMIAKALYDLGYTDQRRGGETCGSLDNWLYAHGFLRSTSLSDVKRGSIMLVKHNGKSYIDHAFVFASDFNLSTMRGDRFDCGSQAYIDSVQPIRDVGFWYRTDDVVVYNIPES